MDHRVKTNDFKLVANSGTRTNGYYLVINHFSLEIKRRFLTIRAARFCNDFLKGGDLVKYWAIHGKHECLKEIREWGVCNSMSCSSLSHFSELSECSFLFYTHLFCFLNSITPIWVPSRIKNRQWPRSVDLTSGAPFLPGILTKQARVFLKFPAKL